MEQFKRIIKQIGEEKFNLIQNKTVLIIGLGGVGGYATEVLARSGISNFILIDFDKIDITNINRQIIALNNNINNLKVNLWENRIKLINPNASIIKLDLFLNKDNITILDKYKIDYIVDACDSLFTKEALISYAQTNQIKIISSMGMGNKLDPSKVKITKLSKTTYDPIAKKLRKFVKDNRLKDIPVVASTEEPIKTNADFITSNAFIPAISGILMGSYIINDIV